MTRTRYNLKRRLGQVPEGDARSLLAAAVCYGGNPEHKRNPGDFGLTPPVSPRPDKTLCDTVAVLEREEALRLLRLGIKRGLVSEQMVGSYPQNVWSMTDDGVPLEAQLENRETGTYHGYPLPESDPFRQVVEEAWAEIEP